MKERTWKQKDRQNGRAADGRYAEHNPCYRCGKSAGSDYSSGPYVDRDDERGRGWNDPDVIGLITDLANDYGVSYLAAIISVSAFIDDYIAAAERERDPDIAGFCRPEPRGPWPNMYRDGLD